MNKYKKALNTIGDTLTYYMVGKDLGSLPSCNEIFDSMDTLRELVDKEKPMSGNDLKYCPTCGQALDWEDKKENVRNQEAE